MTKFASNKNESVSTKLFLFFATKILYSYISFEKEKLFNTSIYKWIFNQKV